MKILEGLKHFEEVEDLLLQSSAFVQVARLLDSFGRRLSKCLPVDPCALMRRDEDRLEIICCCVDDALSVGWGPTSN